MPISMNTNLMAINAARNLGIVYGRLGNTTESLSSGLRIKRSADDPVQMAVRELMRHDISSINQGLRNATDGVSLIQTADGAMAVIDEKLTRMRELAEQAATGTYTTIQREIMNSEYQAMSREIDRIAQATNFNGAKLLDGSTNEYHNGSGIKIHFGKGNSIKEDYYFVNIGNMTTTSENGLRVGGDSSNDVWMADNFSGQQIKSLNDPLVTTSDQAFAYSYNYQGDETLTDADLHSPSYLAGVYTQTSGSSLNNLLDSVNKGTQSRIRINFGPVGSSALGSVSDLELQSGGALNICLGNEVYQFVSGGVQVGVFTDKDVVHVIDTAGSGARDAAEILAEAVIGSSMSFWAAYDSANNYAYVFCSEGGNQDSLFGCDYSDGASAINASTIVSWTNVETWQTENNGTHFGLGGEHWGELKAQRNGSDFNVSLSGQDLGDNFNLQIIDADAPNRLNLSNLQNVNGLTPEAFTEISNASDGPWAGANIRSQSTAQEALDQLTTAISQKDKARATLGVLKNGLENTITQLGIQQEQLQVTESTISDVDMAKAMTVYTRDNVISQAAIAMIAQSNSNGELALRLIL